MPLPGPLPHIPPASGGINIYPWAFEFRKSFIFPGSAIDDSNDLELTVQQVYVILISSIFMLISTKDIERYI
jgi:hypothetical protein